MKILQSSDYRIYFDDVRMDPYVKVWTGACGLRASDAQASITMYRTPKLEMWKGYLTQVRIFARNIFSGQFSILFEGEIVNRSWGDQRNDTGEIVFYCKGFYHWLDIPIPLMISNQDSMNLIQKFKYEAMNIDVDAVVEWFTTKENIIMKDLNLRAVIDALFERINQGYYLYSDSAFAFANLQDRFKVMSDIIKEFRDAGYLDTFTFVRTTQIDSFYVYLNQILTQMMFEFYQDRDGAFRIKNPSWKEPILKAHILDESVVQNATGFNDWENEPTRVLVIGGPTDTEKYNQSTVGADNYVTVPMGLYIGLPGKGQYFSQNIEVLLQEYGIGNEDAYTGGNANFFDDITGNYSVTSKFGPRGGEQHNGTDYGMRYAPLKNLGVYGEVTLAQKGNATAGNWVIIKQSINNQEYNFVYMHLSQIDVNVGDMVSPGQQIGVTGSTGKSTGPHLHLEVWKGARRQGTALDPEVFLKQMKNEGSISGNSGSSTVTNLINMDLKNPNTVTAQQLNEWINSKAKSTSLMYNKGQVFFQAGKDSGLNPVYLVAHAAHETGWGTSRIAREKFNFYGIAAYDWDPRNSATKWSAADTGIIEGAKWIRTYFYDANPKQNTLYKMRYSSSGKHNYATDTLWPNKIAEIMTGFKGNIGSGESSNNSGGYTASPSATTGGFSVTTKYSPSTPLQTTIDAIKSSVSKPKGVEYSSFSSDILLYPLPYSASSFKSFLTKRPNNVNVNMICYIIETMSKWREKYKENNRYGLMGVHDTYIKSVLGENQHSQMYNPELNIQHGTLLFSNAYNRFSKKVTFALASLYEGGMSKVEGYITTAGTEDFAKARAVMPAATVAFVDSVIDKFCNLLEGDYITGDPHRVFSNGPISGGPTQPVTSDPAVKDYESSYKPIMSDEERAYKVNLKISEQLLIRYDTASPGGGTMDADELVQRYAKYMMQLYRAESHGVTVNLSTCLPFLRPGYNAWLEPTRRDRVFYITRVSHQGSFGQGAITSVTGGFVRDPKSFDDIEDNIFVGQTNASVQDFGEIVPKNNMDALRTELKALHDSSDEFVGDARQAPSLSKMYSSAKGNTTQYTTLWNTEMSDDLIVATIGNLYRNAPKVVNTRKKELKAIVDESADFFTQMLLNTKF